MACATSLTRSHGSGGGGKRRSIQGRELLLLLCHLGATCNLTCLLAKTRSEAPASFSCTSRFASSSAQSPSRRLLQSHDTPALAGRGHASPKLVRVVRDQGTYDQVRTQVRTIDCRYKGCKHETSAPQLRQHSVQACSREARTPVGAVDHPHQAIGRFKVIAPVAARKRATFSKTNFSTDDILHQRRIYAPDRSRI